MYSPRDNAALPALGFPIRESADHRLFSASPRLIAAVHALHRLLVPRHPPCALDILTVISSAPFTGHGKQAGRAVREHASVKDAGGPGDTRSCWQLCSFQGPRRAPARPRAPPHWLRDAGRAAGLSKLNSMRRERARGRQTRSTLLGVARHRHPRPPGCGSEWPALWPARRGARR